MLVVFRVLQGFSGGPLMPISQTLLMRVTPPHRVQMGLGLQTMTTILAPIAGPLLLLGAFAVSPKLETAAGKTLAVTAQHPDRYFISTLVAMIGIALLLGAVLGLAHMMRERGTGYGNVGGVIGVLGGLGIILYFAAEHEPGA